MPIILAILLALQISIFSASLNINEPFQKEQQELKTVNEKKDKKMKNQKEEIKKSLRKKQVKQTDLFILFGKLDY
jgi:mannitol-specific phosphotransferase system IIBC component